MSQKQAQHSVTLLPAAPDKCPMCACEHDPQMPHNQQSLFYQYKFREGNGRWPTWKDAIAHCSQEMQKAWRAELEKLGAWSEPVKEGSPEHVLAEIAGEHVEKELPPGAPIPPLMTVETVKIRYPKKPKGRKKK